MTETNAETLLHAIRPLRVCHFFLARRASFSRNRFPFFRRVFRAGSTHTQTQLHTYTYRHNNDTMAQRRRASASHNTPPCCVHPARQCAEAKTESSRNKQPVWSIAPHRYSTHTHTHSCKDQSQEWGSSGGPGAAPAALTFRAGEVRGRAGRRCPRSRRQKRAEARASARTQPNR